MVRVYVCVCLCVCGNDKLKNIYMKWGKNVGLVYFLICVYLLCFVLFIYLFIFIYFFF